MRQLTPKQEKFCLKYIETGSATEAYRAAYDCSRMKPYSVNRNGFAQLEHAKIASRIRTLREKSLQRHNITIDTIVTDLLKDRDMARKTKQAAVAIKATIELAKLHGLYEKHNKQLQPQIMQTILEVIFAELPNDIRARVEQRLTERLSPGHFIELPGPGAAGCN